ncbi:MAG: hypothetical protein GF365_03170 [Candidatus Buchananbacteria bacterium]|nr:hypothetical protein [Candidatus Buchananbacteria bacterium]
MLEKIKKSTMAVITGVIQLNSCYDKQRHKIKTLESSLNKLGNPGFTFEDPEPFYQDAEDEFYLIFIFGTIRWTTLDADTGYSSSLSDISLSMVEPILGRLPSFLEAYQKDLEKTEEENKMSLERLSEVVEALNAVFSDK